MINNNTSAWPKHMSCSFEKAMSASKGAYVLCYVAVATKSFPVKQ